MADGPKKLVGWREWFVGIVAVAAGASLSLYREHRDTGALEARSLLFSAITFCVGLAIVAGVFLYARPPRVEGQPMSDWGRLEGLIPLLGGVYGLLLARGILPSHPKDPEKGALWRRKFGGMMTVLGPIVILIGIAQLCGLFE